MARRSYAQLEVDLHNARVELGDAKQVAFDLRVKLDTLKPDPDLTQRNKDVATLQTLLNQERETTRQEKRKTELLREIIIDALSSS